MPYSPLLNPRPVVVKPEEFSKAYKPPKPSGYMNIGQFFRENIVEVKFLRRGPRTPGNPIGHRTMYRRMLCTANWRFIASPITRWTYKWKPPQSKNRKLLNWYRDRKMIIVWDIISQNFRIISLDKWEIVAAIPVASLLDKVRFFLFYKNILFKWTPNKKAYFADS